LLELWLLVLANDRSSLCIFWVAGSPLRDGRVQRGNPCPLRYNFAALNTSDAILSFNAAKSLSLTE